MSNIRSIRVLNKGKMTFILETWRRKGSNLHLLCNMTSIWLSVFVKDKLVASIFMHLSERSKENTCNMNISSQFTRNGSLTSPRYPQVYTRTNCVYKFYSAKNERIQISFTDFDLGNGDSPKYVFIVQNAFIYIACSWLRENCKKNLKNILKI